MGSDVYFTIAMSELSSATTEKLIVYLTLGTTIILMYVKNPTELCVKICYKHYY